MFNHQGHRGISSSFVGTGVPGWVDYIDSFASVGSHICSRHTFNPIIIQEIMQCLTTVTRSFLKINPYRKISPVCRKLGSSIFIHSMEAGLGFEDTLHLIHTFSPSSISFLAITETIGAYKTSKLKSDSPDCPNPFSAWQTYVPASYLDSKSSPSELFAYFSNVNFIVQTSNLMDNTNGI